MFIQTERTPNPEAIKLLPGQRLTDGGSWSFERTGFEPASSPLAARLFEVEGVRRVFIAPEFLTVSRTPGGPAWDELRYRVIGAVADHLQSGQPAVGAETAASSGQEADQDEIEADIRQVLGLHIGPGVARDGGEVLFDRFDAATGVLWVRMQGACGGCPSSRLTLKASVERIVRRYVPEVMRVEETAAERPSSAAGSRVKRWLSDLKDRAGASPQKTVFTHAGREMQRGPAAAAREAGSEA